MAALDSPTNTLAISYLLSPNHSEERVAARPPSSDPSLLPSSTSISSIDIAAISVIPALSTKFTATPHVLSTTPVHATSTPVISTTPSKTSSVRLSRKRQDGMEAKAKADSKADGEIGSEAGVGIDEDDAYTKDYDTNIKTDIVVDVEAHAQIGVEAEIEAEVEESDGDTIKIGLDVVHPEPVTTAVFPMLTIVVRLVEHGEAIQGMREHLLEMPTQMVKSLEVVETWLRGIVRDEREARARIERQLGLIQEELESL
ncbi:hypothetical protein Tco_1389962, partial [Tanacetum coccineum]